MQRMWSLTFIILSEQKSRKDTVFICIHQHKEGYQLAQVEQKSGTEFKGIGVPLQQKQ